MSPPNGAQRRAALRARLAHHEGVVLTGLPALGAILGLTIAAALSEPVNTEKSKRAGKKKKKRRRNA